MLRENKSEKHGQFILYSTVTAKPEVRWPLIIKCFVCERTYDKVESDYAISDLNNVDLISFPFEGHHD